MEHSGGWRQRAGGLLGVWPAAVGTCPWPSSIVNRELHCSDSQVACRTNTVILSPDHRRISRERQNQILTPRLLPQVFWFDLRWDPESGVLPSLISDSNARPALGTTEVSHVAVFANHIIFKFLFG